MDGHSSCAPRIVGPRVQFSGACEQSHWWPASAYSRAICYQWFKQRLILSVVSKPSISQRSQIKENTVELSVPAREFNLKAYAAITWHNDPANLGLEPRLADNRSQGACSATLPTAPSGQAWFINALPENFPTDSHRTIVFWIKKLLYNSQYIYVKFVNEVFNLTWYCFRDCSCFTLRSEICEFIR